MNLKHGWKQIISESDFQAALKESEERPVVIFKHSVTCGISAHKFFDMENDWNATPDQIGFYYFGFIGLPPDVELSCQGTRLYASVATNHYLKDGKPVAHTSHAYATFDFVKR